MPVKPWFPTLIYAAPLKSRGNTAFARSLLEDCYKLRDNDSAGRRWSQQNYPGGYTSYNSAARMHRMSPTFAALEKRLDQHVRSFARTLDFDLCLLSPAQS